MRRREESFAFRGEARARRNQRGESTTDAPRKSRLQWERTPRLFPLGKGHCLRDFADGFDRSESLACFRTERPSSAAEGASAGDALSSRAQPRRFGARSPRQSFGYPTFVCIICNLELPFPLLVKRAADSAAYLALSLPFRQHVNIVRSVITSLPTSSLPVRSYRRPLEAFARPLLFRASPHPSCAARSLRARRAKSSRRSLYRSPARRSDA